MTETPKKYALESFMTNPPIPAAIWEMCNGYPQRIICIFKGSEATLDEAKKILNFLNQEDN